MTYRFILTYVISFCSTTPPSLIALSRSGFVPGSTVRTLACQWILSSSTTTANSCYRTTPHSLILSCSSMANTILFCSTTPPSLTVQYYPAVALFWSTPVSPLLSCSTAQPPLCYWNSSSSTATANSFRRTTQPSLIVSILYHLAAALFWSMSVLSILPHPTARPLLC
jgi:hypothetical protein